MAVGCCLMLLCAAEGRIFDAHGAAPPWRPDPLERSASRALLQTLSNCTTIANCATCRNQRVAGTKRSEVVCVSCAVGYRLRRDGILKTCDCAPGYYRHPNGTCIDCLSGNYCLGGPANVLSDCGTGLATLFVRAKSVAQCNTKPGFGRVTSRDADGRVTVTASPCAQGSYNTGRNQAACQKCGSGLTTEAPGATNSSLCVAPPGSYKDKGIGKRCPRGTHSEDYNAGLACQACPDGLTTDGDGADSPDKCAIVQKGYYKANLTTALPCPLHTYNAAEAEVTACTGCPRGMMTQDVGATGLAVCLIPPGMELVTDGNITECAAGWYKDGWNRNNCTSCGAGLTSPVGAVARESCLVPAGFGLTSPAAAADWAAAPCELGAYGADEARPAASNVRCVPCPTGTLTGDQLGTPRSGPEYTSETACLVRPGWGMTAAGAEECLPGTYNAGRNRAGCTACGPGLTSPAGAVAPAACVAQAGWEIVGGVPQPCDEGSWSVEGNGTCQACPAGFSTQLAGSTSLDDCAVCTEGHGLVSGVPCALCSYNSFAAPGGAPTAACTPCAGGAVSRRGAWEDSLCIDALQSLSNDALALDPAALSPHAAPDHATCAADCAAASSSCVLYAWRDAADPANSTCNWLLEATPTASTVTLGLKVIGGADFVLRALPAGTAVGAAIGGTPSSASGSNATACAALCRASAECEAFTLDAAGACLLRRSELSEVAMRFTAVGSKLASDAGAA
ncbi:hypothetical protein HT031_005109 [Scenedesmus sp. PABB004]|nr:hypothetical protein HT031_005109 [Scenedesmus sp. PABB004]